MSMHRLLVGLLALSLGAASAACGSGYGKTDDPDVGDGDANRAEGDENPASSDSGSQGESSSAAAAPVASGGSSSVVTGAGATTGTGGASTAIPYAAAGGTVAGDFSSGAVDMGEEAEPPPADPDNEGDEYQAVGTNPFTLTAYDPLSTFAADVDTASYDIFRRDINDGTLPIPDSVRLEEYVNYFRYDYPAPAHDSPDPFQISLAAAPNLLDRDTVMLRVGIQGKAAPPRDPANLVFLVDTSGSMSSADKLPLVREMLLMTLEVLEPEDKVSIVTYAGTVGVALEPTSIADYGVIESAIRSLGSGGSTAGAAGIELAYEQAEAGLIDGGINHVFLCTDGDFNVGISDTDQLVALIEDKRETGITFTALGFGSGNLNDAMMEAISNAGNGQYAVISDLGQAQRYVGERLLSTMLLIAKDMKLQVEFNPVEVYAYRLLGYENRAIADEQFRDDTVDAGEIGAKHRVTALYELVLLGSEIPAPEGAPQPKDGEAYTGEVEVDPADLVLVKVRYKDVDATETDPAYEVNAHLAPAEVATSYTALDSDFQWALSIAAFAEILKDSPYADATALPIVESVFSDSDNQSDNDRVEFAGLFAQAQALLAQ
jgi:Ca-activated chloride channel family protein